MDKRPSNLREKYEWKRWKHFSHEALQRSIALPACLRECRDDTKSESSRLLLAVPRLFFPRPISCFPLLGQAAFPLGKRFEGSPALGQGGVQRDSSIRFCNATRILYVFFRIKAVFFRIKTVFFPHQNGFFS